MNPIPNKFGFTVHWTKFNGDQSSIGATGYATEDEAINDMERVARRRGWTPRKWWHWWRKNDTPNPPKVISCPSLRLVSLEQ